MANNLSLSLWRNSSTPKNSESPVANNEAINKIGNSSIRLGISDASTLQDFNCEEETLKSPTSSLPNFLKFSIFISASIEFKTSKRAILVEFKPTSLIKTEESGVINAPTIMKADIKIENIRKFGSEEVGDLRVSSSQLKPCKVGASLIPNLIDELPILFIASLFATGDSEFFGVEELRHKESDRLLAMQSGLKNIEIETIYNSGKLTIEGKGSDYLIDSGTVDSFEDHRIAMAFIIAGLRSKKNLVVKNTDCIKTSFPEFSYLLDSLGAKINEIQ